MLLSEALNETKERCERLRNGILARNLAPLGEVEAFWPGGEFNRGTDFSAWLGALSALASINGRGYHAEQAHATPANQSVLDDALIDAPKIVTLSTGVEVRVFPKSKHALEYIEMSDRRIAWLTTQRAELAQKSTAEDLDLLERVMNEIEHQYRTMAWIAVHEGPKLPFDDHTVSTGYPDIVQDLSPTDYLLVRNAFLEVNALRLSVLMQMMMAKSNGDDPRPGWGTFFALREEESHVSARSLMRDRSLVSQLAASLTVGSVREKAEEKAKAKQS